MLCCHKNVVAVENKRWFRCDRDSKKIVNTCEYAMIEVQRVTKAATGAVAPQQQQLLSIVSFIS
jgi:hypothetical protein